jgi:YD repeat-containing protein
MVMICSNLQTLLMVPNSTSYMRFSARMFYLFFLIIMTFTSVHGQFYYKDIWTQNQLNKELTILKNEKLRTISVKSFEDDGSPSEGFFLQRKIDKEFTRSETISRSAFTPESILIALIDENGRIIRTTDSTQNSVNVTKYTYDSKGKMNSVSIITRAAGETSSITEERVYNYNEKGQPSKLIRTRDGKKIGDINFILDEAGNVIEELDNVSRQKYYYYYDTKHRLTDVVRYNAVARRLLPDYMFSYSAGGNISQQVSVAEGTGNYFIWKYTYNEFGLKETEKVYSKERRLLGTVEYNYK